MKPLISKEEFKELEKIKGEVKGNAILENMEFVLKKEGEHGLGRLERAMGDLGCPFKKGEVKAMLFYPLWKDAVMLVAIKRLFGYDDEAFQEMGRFEPKISFLIRLFAKYFVSVEKAIKEVSGMWRKTFTVGNLKITEYDMKKRRGILRLENYSLHPIQCQIFKGYFASIGEMVIGQKVTCQEIKCVHRGDEYHEFLIQW